jgi:cytochrome c-type biogenesis protein CcmH/NrfF
MLKTEDEHGLLMHPDIKRSSRVLFIGMFLLVWVFPVGVIVFIIGLVYYLKARRIVLENPEVYSIDNIKLGNRSMRSGFLSAFLIVFF